MVLPDLLEASRRFYKLLSLTYILYRKCTVETASTVQKVHSGAYGGHFGYCRRFGVAHGEREPLAPLGCYIYGIALYGSFPGRTNLSVLPGLLEASRSFYR